MRTLKVVLLASALALSSVAQAGLTGQLITGSLRFNLNPVNYFSPINGLVPAGCGNSGIGNSSTVVVSDPGTDFCFADAANVDSADFFDDGTLVITDRVLLGATYWRMTFTSVTPGLFASLALVSDSFIPGLTFGLVGDTITIDWAGTNALATYQAVFSIGFAGRAPEPASLTLLGIGLASLAHARRKKRAQSGDRR